MENHDDLMVLTQYLDTDDWVEEHDESKVTPVNENKLARLFGLTENSVKGTKNKPAEPYKRPDDIFTGLERTDWFAAWDFPVHRGWYEVQRNAKYEIISRLFFDGQYWFMSEVPEYFYDESKIVHLDGTARWRGLAQPFKG
jgi:hypothetical protein